MNRRQLIIAALSTPLLSVAVAQPKKPIVTPARAEHYGWITGYTYDDMTLVYATTLQVTAPDGTMHRRAAVHPAGRKLSEAVRAEIEQKQKELLAGWALRQFGIIVPTN